MTQLTLMLQPAINWISARLAREEGQDFVEYAVIIAVVVVVAAVAYTALGGQISAAIGGVAGSLAV